MKSRKAVIVELSIAVMFLCFFSTVLVGLIVQKTEHYDFIVEEDSDITAVKNDYIRSGSNIDLHRLLLLICHQIIVSPVEKDSLLEDFKKYGTELYNRAKNRTLDLETISDPYVTKHMLELLNTYGISP